MDLYKIDFAAYSWLIIDVSSSDHWCRWGEPSLGRWPWDEEENKLSRTWGESQQPVFLQGFCFNSFVLLPALTSRPERAMSHGGRAVLFHLLPIFLACSTSPLTLWMVMTVWVSSEELTMRLDHRAWHTVDIALIFFPLYFLFRHGSLLIWVAWSFKKKKKASQFQIRKPYSQFQIRKP